MHNPAIVHAIDAVLMPSWINKTVLAVAESAGEFFVNIRICRVFSKKATAIGLLQLSC
jgi:hypothetical protein